MSSTVLHITNFVYIVDICFGKNFALKTIDSDYPNALLNRHYLMKQSSPDKRGLTVFLKITKHIFSRKLKISRFDSEYTRLHVCNDKKYFPIYVALWRNNNYA